MASLLVSAVSSNISRTHFPWLSEGEIRAFPVGRSRAASRRFTDGRERIR